MSVAHATFCLERTYDASQARVFAAFATEEGKRKWFSGGNEAWNPVAREFDFKVGGREVLEGKWKTGMISRFDATYYDIIEGERIVYVYEMRIDGKKISTSLATVEVKPEGEGTRLTVTEQGVYIDGDNPRAREIGTASLLERLRESLR